MNTLEQTIELLTRFRNLALDIDMDYELYYDVANAIAASTEDYPRKNKNYVTVTDKEYQEMYDNYDLYPPGLHTLYVPE